MALPSPSRILVPAAPHPEPRPTILPSGTTRWVTHLTPRQGQAWTKRLLRRPVRPLPSR